MYIEWKPQRILFVRNAKIFPGVNEIKDEVWNKIEKDGILKTHIENGNIKTVFTEVKEVEEKVSVKDNDGKKIKTTKKVKKKTTKKKLNVNERLEIAEKCNNPVDLRKMLEKESDETIRAEIKNKLDELKSLSEKKK